jgi:hypothetical protein
MEENRMKHGKSIAALAVALLFTLAAGQASADGRDRDRGGDRAVAHSTVKVHLSGQRDNRNWKHDDRRHDNGWHHGQYRNYDKHRHGYAPSYGHFYRQPPRVVRYVPVPRYYAPSGHHHGGLNIVLKF